LDSLFDVSISVLIDSSYSSLRFVTLRYNSLHFLTNNWYKSWLLYQDFSWNYFTGLYYKVSEWGIYVNVVLKRNSHQ
jgi:uncharacterized membrane protein